MIMRLWKVKVRRHCIVKGKRNEDVQVASVVWMILEAEESSAAMELGAAHAEKTANIGPKWIGFEPLEAASIALPFILTEWEKRS